MNSATTINATVIQPTPWQAKIMAVPEEINLFLLGGRGSGKTYLICLEIIRRAERYPGNSRTLVLRRTATSLQEFKFQMLELLELRYGRGNVQSNAQAGYFKTPDGSLIQCGHLESKTDVLRWQGQSYDCIVFDEFGQLPSMQLYDLMLASLRTTGPAPTRVICAGNPGGLNHGAIVRRFLRSRKPWQAHTDELTGHRYLIVPGTMDDNPLLPASYKTQLGGIAATDPGLHAAWVSGDWDSIQGEFFAGVWDPDRIVIPSFDHGLPPHLARASRLAIDWGSTAPAVALWLTNIGRAPLEVRSLAGGIRTLAAGSWLVYEELSTAEPSDPNRGDGTSAGAFAIEVRECCARWKVQARGVMDSSTFASASKDQATVAALFRAERVRVRPAKKKGRRAPRLAQIRQLLANAGTSKPGLYFTANCSYSLETIPSLPRSTRNPEDTDPRAPDHALDALSYGIVGSGSGFTVRNG
tara:strand:+ start:7206 stop:8612 length:1407 start_codon:yes stop_codon:yes gene_type:complete